jgi:two-component system, LytTR family, response regulator
MAINPLLCIIVDDEDLAVQLLRAYAGQHPHVTVLAATTQALELPQLLQQHAADVLFLDIQMPQRSGLQLAQQLGNSGPMLVFTTAYSQYAVEGFDLRAVDYLLKPFSFDRFAQAVQKCLDYRQYRQLLQQAQQPDCIYIKADGKMVKVLLADILYIEGWKQYIKIFTAQKNWLTLESMKQMEAQLPAGQFVRVHKSYIVAVNHVSSYGLDAVLVGGQSIPVGKTYRAAVKRRGLH